MTLSQEPYFLPVPKGVTGGVDYLGMRAINLQMMDNLLPSLNNIANRIRPFSLMTWAIWHFGKTCVSQKRDLSSKEFARFREKLEVLYIWSHQLIGRGTGIPGSAQVQPGGNLVQLSFRAFGRNPTNTFLNAVNYGPGLKGSTGLKFAYPVAADIFKVTAAGVELAEAFDKALREGLTAEQFGFLTSLERFEISAEEVLDYAKVWHIDAPSPNEQRAFVKQLYQPNEVGKTNTEGLRAGTISLILKLFAQSRSPLSAQGLREAMAIYAPPLDDDTRLAKGMQLARLRWQALQVRQAQRLAMEALFGWLERCIWEDDARSTSQICRLMLDAIKQEQPTCNVDVLLRDRIQHYRELADTSDELFGLGGTSDEVNIVRRMQQLQKTAANFRKAQSLPLDAFDLLALCAVYAEHLLNQPESSSVVVDPALHRLPLQWWVYTASQHAAIPFSAFLEKFIETWLVSQHLGVAASRFSDDSGRMRLSIEDGGLVSVLAGQHQCWSPVLTPDRIHTVLSLMAQCGLLMQVNGDSSEPIYLRGELATE